MAIPAALAALLFVSILSAEEPLHEGPVQVSVFENLPEGQRIAPSGQPTSQYGEPAMAFVRIPAAFSRNALAIDRSAPFTLRAEIKRELPAGEYRFRLRSKGLAAFSIDGAPLLHTPAQMPNRAAHDALPETPKSDGIVRPAPPPHRDALETIRLEAGEHVFALIAVIGGKGLAPFPGELSVSYARPGEVDRVLGGENAPLLTDADWERYVAQSRERHLLADIARRRASDDALETAWEKRHQEVREWESKRAAIEPPRESFPAASRNSIDRFINAKLAEAKLEPSELISDLEFLRRVTLDTTGLIPTRQEVDAYLAESQETRRETAIARLLDDPGWADHWVAYWQDVLAENPGILKPDLNNTGPFRWYLHQAFLDGYPFDRIVTELVEMEGSLQQGAPAGFGMASLNDAPMAAKADILSQAFLGNKLSCARCHDAPFHPFMQKDLYSMAALLDGKPIVLPESSTVPVREGGRRPYVQITLKAGEAIDPHWPFQDLADELSVAAPPSNTLVESRHALATLLVSPSNQRFARVVVNRVWKRYIGRGIVEPADDWSNAKPSHPELMDWLARELLNSGYDLKHLAGLIFRSHSYQRRPVGDDPSSPTKGGRLFAGPMRRTMTAEQLADSIHHLAGKNLDSEELNLNPLGDRSLRQFLNMGVPRRAWEMTALSNERDRPSLALPRAQSLIDLMAPFGWRQSRQAPATDRDDGASPMQTLALANGSTGTRVVRLSDDSFFTSLALQDRPLEEMIETSFVRVLTRSPTDGEMKMFAEHLQPAFADRVVNRDAASAISERKKTNTAISWANHFDQESTLIRMEEERSVRMGDPPTERLTADFRERYEDFVWAMVNSPEFMVIP